MSVKAYKPEKIFTVEEANATLPLVGAITADMMKLAHEIVDRRERLSHLKTPGAAPADDPYAEELVQVERELEKQGDQLQEYVEELRQLGVEPKNASDGLVDFPALIDGQLAYLCWRADEPEILYWHSLDAGFSGRKRLTADMAAGDGAGCGDNAMDCE